MQVAVNTNQDIALEHLKRRLCDIRYAKVEELRGQFHLTSKYPKDVKEAKKWLNEGYYHWTVKDDEEEAWDYWSEHFRWGTEKGDRKGFESAVEKLNNLFDAAKDIVVVKTDEDARLKALHDFESATFH